MDTAEKTQIEQNEVEWNSFVFALSDWVRNWRLEDSERWLAELEAELAEIPRLEKEIENLRLQIDVSLQSLLLDKGFSSDEIFELMRMPATAIDIVESNGGLLEWKAK